MAAAALAADPVVAAIASPAEVSLLTTMLFAIGGWIIAELHEAVKAAQTGDALEWARVAQTVTASLISAYFACEVVTGYLKYPVMAGYAAAWISAYAGTRLVALIGAMFVDWVKGIIMRFTGRT